MMIKAHPLLGFGPGTFGIIYPLFKTKLAEETIMAHNSFLQLWAESGFLTLGAFALFIYLIFSDSFKNRSKLKAVELGALAAFLSFSVQNFFDFGLFDMQRSTVAFGLLGLYSLHRAGQSRHIVINSKQTKIAISVFCGLLLMVIIFYSSNIFLARHFDSAAGLSLRQGHIKAAVDLSGKAVKHAPLTAEYFYHRGYIFENIARQSSSKPIIRKETSEKAIADYRSAIKLNPFAAYYHLRLGQLLFITRAEGYEISAPYHLKKAIQMYPQNPFYHEQLAQFYDIIGDQEKKEFELNQARELKIYFKKGTRN